MGREAGVIRTRFIALLCLLLLPASRAAAGPEDWLAPWSSANHLFAWSYPGHFTLGSPPEKFALDFPLEGGCDLYVPTNGRVMMYRSGVEGNAPASMEAYGNFLMFKPDDYDAQIIMAHLEFICPPMVKRFNLGILSVQQGEYIGRMGSTGNSSGTHLHFEVTVPRGDIPRLFGMDVLSLMYSGTAGGIKAQSP